MINHENTMFKTYTEIIGKYSVLFKQYDYFLLGTL